MTLHGGRDNSGLQGDDDHAVDKPSRSLPTTAGSGFGGHGSGLGGPGSMATLDVLVPLFSLKTSNFCLKI
jgi:hypothetical protein